jgi:hypothetical protein
MATTFSPWHKYTEQQYRIDPKRKIICPICGQTIQYLRRASHICAKQSMKELGIKYNDMKGML